MTTAVEAPKPGDLVWVDWGNRQNWTDPIYVRPLLETSPPGAGGAGGGGAGGACGGASGGSYSAGGAPGNSVAGSNISTKPYAGLPRLKRSPAPKGTAKTIVGEAADPKKVKQWEENAVPLLPPGKSWVGHLSGNGPNDPNRKGNKRQNIIWFSNTTDFTQKWELIYFLHGHLEFTAHSFKSQGGKQLAAAFKNGRNFVCVMPEATFSASGKKGKDDSSSFRTDKKDGIGGDFALYHDQVMNQLGNMAGLGSSIKPSFISIFAHSAGGGTLAYIAAHGGLAAVKPNRIFLSDCDYGWTTIVGDKKVSGTAANCWEYYVKGAKNVWMTLMSSKGKVRKRMQKWMKKHAAEIKDRMIYEIPSKWGHGKIGANCINVVSEDLINKDKEAEKKKAEEAKKEPLDEEKADNDAAAEAAKEEKDKEDGKDPEAVKDEKDKKEEPPKSPKKEETGKNPPATKPANSASANPKTSTTPKKPTWKGEPSKPFTENRVKVKHYGGTVTESNSPLLEVANIWSYEYKGKPKSKKVKLHKLYNKRFQALKIAAAAAGFPDVKLSSGWRRHSWKSKEHYDSEMIRRYGSVKEGRNWVAYSSAHETGLAMDFNCHGVVPSKKKNKAGKQTPFYKWLVENAHKWGITPYKKECWHWELRLPYDSWATGEEFTKDMAIRVTNIGGKNAQMAQGGSSGGGSGGGGGGGGGSSAPCVRTGSGGSGAPPGPFTPGPAMQITGGGSLGNKLIGGPSHFHKPNRNMKEVKLFVLHETAGHPNRKSRLLSGLKSRPPNKGVHFWGSCEGYIVQTAPVEARLPHANSTNGFSCGIEVCCFGNGNADYAVKWKERLARGMHQVSHKGKGDIACEPGKLVASSPHSGAQHLPTWQQCDSTWKLIAWLSKNPPKVQGQWAHGGKKGTPVIKIPIKFPCVPSKTEFHWSKWNGAPTRDKSSADAWFKKHQPAGIVSHARINSHHDGMSLEYYCLGRAQGLSSKDAYYALVGALCSGEKTATGTKTKHPKHYVSLGKKKYKTAWFTGKTRYWVGKKKWKELAAANPAWFANAPTSAKA